VCAAGDRLYCAGPDGTLYCLKAADGALIWQVDGRTWWPLRTDGKREIHSSFLVADGVAVIQGGGHDGPHCNEGAVAALDAETGALLWSEQKYGGEGSPVLWRTGEQAYVLILARDGLTAFDLRTGKALWAVTPGSSSGTPLVVGDYAVILSDTIRKYGLTCYRLSPDKAEQVWQVADRYDPGSVPVVHDGHLYATAANRGENGGYTRATLLCVELATGALKWEEKTPCGGYTTPILADGKLIYANQGEVVMVAADPTRYRELGRMKIEADRYASPAIAGGRLFIRTGRGSWMVGGPGAIACYDLRAGK
jgi:outer membrane protein assembly factor BamB